MDELAAVQAAELAALEQGPGRRAARAQRMGLAHRVAPALARLRAQRLAEQAAMPVVRVRRIGGGSGLVFAIWTGGFPARVRRPHLPLTTFEATQGITFVDLIDGEAFESRNWYSMSTASGVNLPSGSFGVASGGNPFYDLAGATSPQRAPVVIASGAPMLTF